MLRLFLLFVRKLFIINFISKDITLEIFIQHVAVAPISVIDIRLNFMNMRLGYPIYRFRCFSLFEIIHHRFSSFLFFLADKTIWILLFIFTKSDEILITKSIIALRHLISRKSYQDLFMIALSSFADRKTNKNWIFRMKT